MASYLRGIADTLAQGLDTVTWSIRDSIFLAAILALALAAGVSAARTTAAFMRWAISRTLAAEW
jgi:hypothetical protein